MSLDEKVNKAVTYRRCEISPKPGQTLQQLLAAALAKFPKPGDRFEPLNSASTEIRLIGNHFKHKDCLCGFMTSFERGASQPVIADDPKAASLRLGALAPPKTKAGAAQEQYVPGVLYFVIFENHLVTCQSHSMRTAAFEAHLNWLLKSRTSELPATSTFALSDEAQKATKAKIKKSHIKSIAFGQPLMEELPPATPPSSRGNTAAKSGSKKAETRFQPGGTMLNVLRNFFTDDADFEKLGLTEVFDGNLEVWIQIRYPKFKRSRPEKAVALMDTLGIALRDMEGDQVSLELANGHTVSGKELKISGSVETRLYSNKLPDERVLIDNMIDWLKAQIVNGVVDP